MTPTPPNNYAAAPLMSKTDILRELPKLTREERSEVVSKVHEIDGDDWLDEGELSAEERARLERGWPSMNGTPALPFLGTSLSRG